jgi:microcystin synthetase protein McyB
MYEDICDSDPIEDSYLLSPIQQSMLDESLSTTAGERVGLLQLVWDLPESLDLAVFKHAWERTIERHPILRTRLVWRGCPEPFQEVVRCVRLPFETRDWTGLPLEQLEQQLQACLVEDRQQGMSLDQAPLLRVLVVRLRPDHHCVVLTLHHTTFDGRTLLALVQEVFSFYEGILHGEEPELPNPGLYRGYIKWLDQQDQRRAEAFWREALRGIREPTPLGIDEAERTHGARLGEGDAPPVWFYQDFSVWLDDKITSGLLRFARNLGLTLNTLLLGAWAFVLSRYSGCRDVLFGVVRTHRGALRDGAAILGPVMNSVPFRATVAPSVHLASWLQAVRAHWLAMREGDFATPAEIRSWSEFDPRAPFFEALVLFETHELTQRLRQLGPGWRGRSFRFVRQPRVPLSIYGYQESRLALKIIFDPDRFDPSTMRRLLGHLQTALEAMPEAAGRGVTELPLLTAAETHQLLAGWNDTAAAPALPAVHHCFEAQAQRAPQALAVAGPGGSRTYGELEESANRLAWLLAARGVSPDTVVAVLLERSIQEVQALLGVLKAGGTYLPLEGSPPERLDSILEDAGAAVLVTRSSGSHPPLRFPAERILDLDCSDEELRRQPACPPPSWTLPEQPAYVIYTSGSSGRPKGVVVSHRGLRNLVDWHIDAFGVSPADRASRLAGLGFDASVWELWPYWSVGAAVLLPHEETRSVPEALRDWLVREKISLAFVPTPLAERLMVLSWPAGAPLRLLLTGGDALRSAPPPGLPFRLVNNYGPTENSVVATSGYVDPARGPDGDGRSPTIGRPIRNVRTYLLDPDFRPVPMGARGELMIAGTGLAQSYIRRPELTATSFVPDPYGRPGERMYRSGDLARFLSDGTLEFLGRRDSQIKLRGFRIEPGEIEAALDRHPAVQACAVVARGGELTDDKQLIAFLVGRPGSIDDDFDLTRFLRGKLPAYMIPGIYRWLDCLPLTAGGKVDRQALQAQAVAVSGQAREHATPGTPLEQLLAQIWEEVLGCEPVGLDDDFFALGGNSLHIMQVLAALHDIFRREIPADRIFLASTIARLITELFPGDPERHAAEAIAQSTLGVGALQRDV